MVRVLTLSAAFALCLCTGCAQKESEADTEGAGMKTLETTRLTMRRFQLDDWSDVHELAVDWSKAPGPAFDKWPTGEEQAKGMAKFFAESDKYYAVFLRDPGKVIGLVAYNGVDTGEQLDMGHVILSKYQDCDIDKEALGLMLDNAFNTMDIASVITRNDPNDAQLAPLRALGFRNADQESRGELLLTRAEWEQSRQK